MKGFLLASTVSFTLLREKQMGQTFAIFRPECVMPEQKMLYVVRFEFFKDARPPKITKETRKDISELFL